MTDNVCRIVTMKMLETPATAPIYTKRMKSNVGSRTLRMYEDLTSGGRIHSESLLSGVANSSLYYSAEGSKQINMPGGYDQSRFRIIIEFVESAMGSGENVSYITGYTDHFDYVERGSNVDFDADMRIYFNEIRTIAVRRTNNFRDRAEMTVRDSSRILSRIDDDRHSRSRSYTGSDTHLLTPGVVTQVMQADDLHKTLGVRADEIEINDTRTSLMMNNNHRSRTSDRIPTHYLTRILDGYSRSRMSDLRGENDSIRTLANAVKKSGDSSLANSKFFDTLLAETDYDFDGYVTWRDFKRTFDEINSRDCDVEIHTLGRDRIRRSISNENVARWDDASLECAIANIVVSGIPPMMPDLKFESVDFTVHNDTDDGSVMVTIDNYGPLFDNLDMTKEVEQLEYRIEEFLFQGCDFVDNVMFHVQGQISQNDDSIVYVSVDDDEDRVYKFPNWADALATPLLTETQADVMDLADDLKKLISVIDENIESSRESKLILDDPKINSHRRRPRKGV